MQYTLHLTNSCNLSCKYCGLKKNGDYMSKETAFSAIDFAMSGDNSSVGIGFYGGEPLLCKELIAEIIAYVKSKKSNKKIFYKLITNGLLLDQEFLLFAKSENILISISLDGNQQMHDFNRRDRGGNGSYERLLKVVPLLLAQNRYAAAMVTISPGTVKYYSDGIKNLFELGFRTIICSLDYSANWNDKTLRDLNRQYKKLSDLYYRKTISEDKFFFSPFDSKIDSHIHNKEYCNERCKLGYEQISISTFGDLYPCIQFVGDSKYKIGHIHTGIDEAHRKKIYTASQTTPDECKSCDIHHRCTNSCACINKYSTGNITQPSTALCSNEQLLIKCTDHLAARLYKHRNGMFIHKHYNENYSLVSLVEDLNMKIRS